MFNIAIAIIVILGLVKLLGYGYIAYGFAKGVEEKELAAFFDSKLASLDILSTFCCLVAAISYAFS